MKVNGFQPPNSVSQTEQNRSSQATRNTSAADKSKASGAPGDVVTHFSQLPQDASQDIDMARVEELRQAIRDGRLSMNTENIADSLLRSMNDGLTGEAE